ncbi:GntR family transcriptional regulator [Amycolatopsis sp. NBC_00345]|uniref:GntR family transcriptional regulator n=1 Tax=Amycolatopsis sp. NBC_00345 TaxID=2975955 RepID=UPI002E26BF5A
MAIKDEQGRPSLYRRIADDLKAEISAGTYSAGDALPSESELAQRYDASRGTIRQAFAALRTDGIISSRRGARRVVQGGPRLQDFAALLSFSRWGRAIGEEPSGRVVSLDRRGATEGERDHLNLPDGAYIYHLTRVRLLDDRPVMVERTAYPDRIGALVAGMDPDRESITERLAELGTTFADAEHTIDAVRATADDARLLGARPGIPLLRERRRTTDPSGVPLEWSEDRYLGDQVAFTVRNSADRNTLSRWHSAPGSA